MRSIDQFKDDLEAGEVPLRLSCPCRFEDIYGTLDEFIEAGGEFVSETPLIVRCPRCRNVHVGSVTLSEGSQGEEVQLDLDRGSERRELNEFRVGDCPDCGATVRNTDYNQGPGRPDIGWKYYECPECDAGIRPERMGDHPD